MNISDIQVRLEAETDDPETHTVDDVMGVVDEAVNSAIEEHTDVQSVVDESKQLADEGEITEMMFRHVDHMMQVIKSRGCSRDIVAAFDTNGSLTRMIESRLGTSIHLESLDSVGNPYDNITMVTLEGLGEMAKKAWEWIKKIFRKIISFMSRMLGAVMARLGNADKQIGRLRKEYQSRSDRNISDIKKELYDPKHISAIFTTTDEAISHFKRRNDVYNARLKLIISKAKSSGTYNKDNQSDYDKEAQDKTREDSKKYTDRIKDAFDKAKSNKIAAKDITWMSIGDHLRTIEGTSKGIMLLKQLIEEQRVSAKHASQEADRLSNIGYTSADNKSMGYSRDNMEYTDAYDNDNQLKEFRAIARVGNGIASNLTNLVANVMTAQRMFLSTLNTRIMLGKKN